ncbi:MAG: type II secretion system protein [Candidatus Shapirobacteria bacterium]
MKSKRGFSLIELVVVITIMAVITALVSVSFAGAGKRGRDSRRMADLEKIRVALEMIRQVGVTYPSDDDRLVPDYIQALPKDPKGGSYLYSGGGYVYTLDATMEDVGSTTGDYGGGYNYRVTNP